MSKVFVYILKSESTGYFYVGIIRFSLKRTRQHNKGQSSGSRGKGPWKKVYQEGYSSYREARKREKYLKSGIGRDWLRSAFGG